MIDPISHREVPMLTVIGLALSGILVSIGTAWAFDRGANDFTVFYEAWRHVLQGRGSQIYVVSPDRYLYAPGFAWLLAPLGLLPRGAALAIWCFMKAAALGWMIRSCVSLLPLRGVVAWGVGGWAIVMVARPLLIEFQYGQVNLLILSAAAWALTARVGNGNRSAPADIWTSVRWFVLAICAAFKLYALPLLAIPWVVSSGLKSEWLRKERIGVALGIVFILLLPVTTMGWEGLVNLMSQWKLALDSRGIPTESHNQSIAALLYRFFSGNAVHVIAQGSVPVEMGWKGLTVNQITLLSAAWSAATIGILTAWIFKASFDAAWLARNASRWTAWIIGFLVVPSHLVWKPYFVMMLLPAVWLLADAVNTYRRVGRMGVWAVPVLLFLLCNFSGFDFIGYRWAGKLESASILMWVHITTLLFVAARASGPAPEIRRA